MNLVEKTETIINLHLSGKTNEEIQAVINGLRLFLSQKR